MRAKRPYIVLSFRTTVEAMAWEKHCEAEHIPGRLIPLPRELSAGCGLAWRMLPGDWQQWQSSGGCRPRTGSCGRAASTPPPMMPQRW